MVIVSVVVSAALTFALTFSTPIVNSDSKVESSSAPTEAFLHATAPEGQQLHKPILYM